MLAVVGALIVRDLKSRFSGDLLGYSWALLTPLAWVFAIVASFVIIGRQTPISTDAISFVVAGVLPYIVFRYTITSMMKAYKINRFILHIDNVGVGEIMFAASLVELMNGAAVYMVITLLNYLTFGYVEMNVFLVVLYGYILAWLSGASLGYFFAQLSNLSETVVRVLPVIMRPMFWISGIFYTANEVPDSMMKYLSYNPLFQAIEIIRNGMFLGYKSRMADYLYPIIFSLFFIVAGYVVSSLVLRGSKKV